MQMGQGGDGLVVAVDSLRRHGQELQLWIRSGHARVRRRMLAASRRRVGFCETEEARHTGASY
jgi:hypothetical protein